MKIKMDPAQFELLNNARAAQYKKEAEAEAKAKADEEHRKETTKKVIGAVGDIARGIARGPLGAASDVATKGAKAAYDLGSRAAKGEFSRGAIPIEDADRPMP